MIKTTPFFTTLNNLTKHKGKHWAQQRRGGSSHASCTVLTAVSVPFVRWCDLPLDLGYFGYWFQRLLRVVLLLRFCLLGRMMMMMKKQTYLYAHRRGSYTVPHIPSKVHPHAGKKQQELLNNSSTGSLDYSINLPFLSHLSHLALISHVFLPLRLSFSPKYLEATKKKRKYKKHTFMGSQIYNKFANSLHC